VELLVPSSRISDASIGCSTVIGCGRGVQGPGMVFSAGKHGDVAQLVEHLLCKQGVGGSSPLVSTRPR
jgi:hypothetical protein